MAKISDELREFVDENDLYLSQIAKLNDIAWRIDNEMAELPRGKDGKPISAGDTVYGEDGKAWHVRRVVLCATSATDRRYLIKAVGDGGSERGLMAVWLTHERPDSLERIADELDEMVDAADSADDMCEKLADLAGRIRRLAQKEDKR